MKRKYNSKTALPPKLPKKDHGSNDSVKKVKHRDANKKNVPFHEVNAAGWSTVVSEIISQLDRISVPILANTSLSLKAEAFDKFAPLVHILQNAHKKCRKHSVLGASMLKSSAIGCSNSELSILRKDLANGNDPRTNDMLRTLEPEIIDCYSTLICPRPNATETTSSVTEETTASVTDNLIPPPPGWPNKQYGPYELCQIYNDFVDQEDDAALKIKAKELLLKYGKISISTFYIKNKLFKAGKLTPNCKWKEIGRKSKLVNTSEVIKKLVEEERAVHGHHVTIKKVKEYAVSAMKEEWLDRGFSEDSFEYPCDSTLDHYCARILSDPSVNINTHVTNKTQTRFAAEKSDRSSIAYTMAACASHYWPGKPIKGLHVMDEDKMTEGAKLVRELVKEQLGTNEIQNVLPGLCTSTDATTTFATVGQINGKETLYITIAPPDDTDPNAASSSQRSNCTTERHGDRHKRGLRIELNCTFNALGQIAGSFSY
jgi:predicted small metal-binding protein